MDLMTATGALSLDTQYTLSSYVYKPHQAMLARFRITSARAGAFNALKPLRTVIGRPCRAAAARSFHNATAEFTKLGPEGILVTNKVSICVGDPGEAYIVFLQKSATLYRPVLIAYRPSPSAWIGSH
jgi:hypothetical protein